MLSKRPTDAQRLVVERERLAVERAGNRDRHVVGVGERLVHRLVNVEVLAAEVADGHADSLGQLMLQRAGELPLVGTRAGRDRACTRRATIELAAALADLARVAGNGRRWRRSRSASRCSAAAG